MNDAQKAADVTVMIAAWNAEATLARCLGSALAQRGAAVEVIVVDDASQDGTAGIAAAFAARDPRLRLLRQPRNLGPAAARNRALAVASAPWVATLDSDDFMMPDRLSTLLGIARRARADFVADDIFKQDEHGGEETRRRLWSEEEIGIRPLNAEAFLRGNFGADRAGRRELGFLKPLMSRDFLRRHGLAFPDLRLGEDYALYAEALLRRARFVLTDPAGYVATVRSGSLSGDHPTDAHAALVAVDRRLMDLPGVTAAERRALHRHMRAHQKKFAWRRMIDSVRARDLGGALACFRAPPGVGLDLGRRLAGEAVRRTARRATGRAGPGIRAPLGSGAGETTK